MCSPITSVFLYIVVRVGRGNGACRLPNFVCLVQHI